MLQYQNYGYCRYIFIWGLLSLFGIVKSTPLISLIMIIVIEFTTKKDYMSRHKKWGILFSELFFIIALWFKDRGLYLFENLLFCLIYLCILYVNNIDVVALHKIHLKNDDIIHGMEDYWGYLGRVWYLFLHG